MRWCPLSPCVALCAVVLAPVADAATFSANPDNYRTLLDTLQPGDTLLLTPGVYERGLGIFDLDGTPVAPIVITGPASGPRAVLRARSCCNTISIRNSSYIEVRNLDLDGMNLPVDAVKLESDAIDAHHITIEGLVITNHGVDQQVVGISTKAPAWDWVIRGNRIVAAGTGLYLGDSDGSAPFIRGIVEHNVVLDTVGYNMEIKHQARRPSVTGIPRDPTSTIIRHNVFSKAANASRGGDSRPNLLVGHFPVAGFGEDDLYEIYGNFFYQNEATNQPLFQGEGNIAFHDNVLINTFGTGMVVRPHNDLPRQIDIYHNTVYARSRGISVMGAAAGFEQLVAANAVFANDPITNDSGTTRDNITDAFSNAGQHVNLPGDALGSVDFYPKPGRLAGAAVDLAVVSIHVDSNLDFNGDLRDGTHRGAYAGQGANPGWTLARTIKSLGDVTPMVDAGTGPMVDAGVTTDSGQLEFDAAARDASTAITDAGRASGKGDARKDSCSCTTHTSRSGTGWVLLLAIAIVWRRSILSRTL